MRDDTKVQDVQTFTDVSLNQLRIVCTLDVCPDVRPNHVLDDLPVLEALDDLTDHVLDDLPVLVALDDLSHHVLDDLPVLEALDDLPDHVLDDLPVLVVRHYRTVLCSRSSSVPRVKLITR